MERNPSYGMSARDPVLGCGNEGCEGGWLCPIIPVIVIPCIDDCGGHKPPPCHDCGVGNPPPKQPINFPNETLGLPNGFPTNPWGIAGAIIPNGNCGDLGPCNPIGSGFGPEVLAIPLCTAAPEVCALIALGGLTIYAIETFGPPLLQAIHNSSSQSSTSHIDEACENYASEFDGQTTKCYYQCSEIGQLCSRIGSGRCPRVAWSHTLGPCD